MKINEKIFEILKTNYKSEDIWTYWSSKIFTAYNLVFLIGFLFGLGIELKFNLTQNLTQKIFNSVNAKYQQPNYTKAMTEFKEKL